MNNKIELMRGHGDPLYEFIMNGQVDQRMIPDREVKAIVSHNVVGHGDPLFQEVLEREKATTKRLLPTE